MSTGPTREEAPNPRVMTTEEIDSDYDPNENDGYYENKQWMKGVECYTATTVYSAM